MKICGAFGYDELKKIRVANFSSRFFNCFVFILCTNYFKQDFIFYLCNIFKLCYHLPS